MPVYWQPVENIGKQDLQFTADKDATTASETATRVSVKPNDVAANNSITRSLLAIYCMNHWAMIS